MCHGESALLSQVAAWVAMTDACCRTCIGFEADPERHLLLRLSMLRGLCHAKIAARVAMVDASI